MTSDAKDEFVSPVMELMDHTCKLINAVCWRLCHKPSNSGIYRDYLGCGGICPTCRETA